MERKAITLPDDSEVASGEWLDKMSIVSRQIKETVNQESLGITCRMATITCPCGHEHAIVNMFQCLYCKVWFCHQCAETHFGKTVSDYKAEKGSNINRLYIMRP